MSAGQGYNPDLDANHAERMDRMYRYQRHIYDVTRKYYLFGRDHAIRGLQVPAKGSLLEIGCGTGRNLLLAHRLYPTARLYGLDISSEMLATSRANFRGKAVQPVLQVADATTFTAGEFGVDGFDRVMVSYALSMIPDWRTAIGSALSAVKPGGSLHVVDFGQQEKLPQWFRTGLQHWLARFHVTPRADLADVLEEHLAPTGSDMLFETLGRGYAWHAVVRRRH